MNDKPASVRQLPLWLIVSLMANMMLIGLLAGLLLRPAPSKPFVDKSKARFSWVQSEGGGEPVALVLREAFQASESARATRVAARQALADAVAKDPYDEAAVREAFGKLRDADDSVNEATHEAMVKLFATLPVEDRKHMAMFLMRGPGDHPLRRGGRPGERMIPRNEDGGPVDGRMMGPGDGPPPPPPDFEP